VADECNRPRALVRRGTLQMNGSDERARSWRRWSGVAVQRLVSAGVRVDEHRAVGLEHDQPHRLREHGGQPARVTDLATGDDEAHRGKTTMAGGRRRGVSLLRRFALLAYPPNPLVVMYTASAPFGWISSAGI
jgi:hypothetical protein